jgi:hypothetical protein
MLLRESSDHGLTPSPDLRRLCQFSQVAGSAWRRFAIPAWLSFVVGTYQEARMTVKRSILAAAMVLVCIESANLYQVMSTPTHPTCLGPREIG